MRRQRAVNTGRGEILVEDFEWLVPEKEAKEPSSAQEIRDFRALQKSEKCTPKKVSGYGYLGVHSAYLTLIFS